MDITNLPLYHAPSYITTVWFSPENPHGKKGVGGTAHNGRKGTPALPVEAGDSLVLAHISGTAGTIRRIWATISDRSADMLRGLRIDIFWNGADTPAVSVPFGDFFCHGLGRVVAFDSALFSSPEARSFCSFVPMPFHSEARIVVTNETDRKLDAIFYDVNATVGDQHDDNTLLFHAHWRRENPTTELKDYSILPTVHGRGRYIGACLGVIANTKKYYSAWWGEGECKIYIDGDTDYPTLCGTGTEDYIATGWGQGRYDHLYHGCHLADVDRFHYAFYRFHIPDPVYFHENIRVDMQQIGCWGPDNISKIFAAQLQLKGAGIHNGAQIDMAEVAKKEGYGLFERSDDWSSCVYFYVNSAHQLLPTLPAVAERTEGLYTDPKNLEREDV